MVIDLSFNSSKRYSFCFIKVYQNVYLGLGRIRYSKYINDLRWLDLGSATNSH